MSTAAAVAAHALSKIYRNGTRALDAVDLDIRQGEVFCLLGPNGAGKTTLTRIVGTHLTPTSGRVSVLGLDVTSQAQAIRSRIVVVPQQSWPDEQLTVFEHVYYYLMARGLRRQHARKATEAVLERVGLGGRRDAPILSLSGGTRRRVLLAMALASPASLMLLDEPSTDLDVIFRRELWNVLLQARHERTILLTTHSMEEAEALADRVAIVSGGHLIACGSVAQLRAQAPAPQKIIFPRNGLRRDRLDHFGHVHDCAGQMVVFPRSDAAMQALLTLAVEAKVDAQVSRANLEDAFVHLIQSASDTAAELLR